MEALRCLSRGLCLSGLAPCSTLGHWSSVQGTKSESDKKVEEGKEGVGEETRGGALPLVQAAEGLTLLGNQTLWQPLRTGWEKMVAACLLSGPFGAHRKKLGMLATVPHRRQGACAKGLNPGWVHVRVRRPKPGPARRTFGSSGTYVCTPFSARSTEPARGHYTLP